MENSQRPFPAKRAATLRVKNTLASRVHVGGVMLFPGQVGEVPNDADGVNKRDIEGVEGLEIESNSVAEAQDDTESPEARHSPNTDPAAEADDVETAVDPAAKFVTGLRLEKRQWSIHHRERFDALAQAIYDTLRAELSQGRKRPSASGLLALWKQGPPTCVVRFKANGVVWSEGDGREVIADKRNLQDRIYRMTNDTAPNTR